MFATRCGSFLRIAHKYCSLSTTAPSFGKINSALNLDPSLQALLNDVDISLTRHKIAVHSHRELDVIPSETLEDSATVVQDSEHSASEEAESLERKSPAAIFGSQGIGAVVLPLEMQNSINLLIAEADKQTLHSDAKRLFQMEGVSQDAEWNSNFDTKYRSRIQASRHSDRDGTAFASIALPAHYSAIRAVLTHVSHRLGPDWSVSRVIDWGTATGSGLWASVHVFQHDAKAIQDAEGLTVSDTTIQTYIGIDKRDGLVAIGKRLFRDIKSNNLTILWQRSFHDDDKIPRALGHDTIALSAFNLSSLPTSVARKTLVKEMWESGAHTMILIDHNTPTGFEHIADARELLLKMGRKEMDDPSAEGTIRGSHVVAPCPHDGHCPLHHPGSIQLVCGFSQRLQRPSFVRLTKHSTTGHEDTGYSYVVVQRGERPTRPESKLGRVGGVGKRELDKESETRPVMKELRLHSEEHTEFVSPEASDVEIAPAVNTTPLQLPLDPEMKAKLRQEAYSWPRIIFPPLKKSGHIILDTCTPAAKIMRLIVPKSQGKQPYYDARKSNWGDIFPHEPKNAPQERYQPRRAKRTGGTTAVKGSDIGKRAGKTLGEEKMEKGCVSYEELARKLKEDRKKSMRDTRIAARRVE